MLRSDSLSRVSVVIPTYNRSKLLRLTVESVLAQTYPNIEIIVVDDGSTDDTAAVMEQYAGRVTYIKENHGCGGRRIGLLAASGDYINFLDHDDLMMPTKVERQVQVLDSYPEIGLVHCGYYHIDEDGNRLEKISFLPDGTLKELVCSNSIWSGAPLIRRQCLAEIDGYYDWGMWLDIAQAGYRFTCIQEPLGAYRILPGSEMSNVSKMERIAFATLDRVFADPQLPAEVLAVKDTAYGNTRFWISCRYYEAGQWDAAQRNLAEAIALRPNLLEHPADFLDHLSEDVLSAQRLGNPINFVEDVFDHLPACAESLRSLRSHLLGRVYAGLALRSYARGGIAEAKCQLAKGIELAPAMFERTDGFAELLAHYAWKLPVSQPFDFVDAVLQNLPGGAQRLERVRSRVIADLNIACAFQDYSAGRRHLVTRRVLAGLRYRPSWFKNRGVISIFLKSLMGLPSREHTL
jgi:tetratricopeptide (TPR) repeat protein